MLSNTPALLLALFLAPLASQEPSTPQGLQFQGEYVILDFSGDEDEGPSLHDFIQTCQSITGRTFTLHEQAAHHGQLEKRLVLIGEKKVLREDFFEFFQTMMKVNGFVCVPQGSVENQVLMITPINATTQPTIKAGAIFVQPEDVQKYANQPGTWITTVVPLKHAQAAGLGTSLRTALGGAATGQDAFMPLQRANAILIQNFGPFAAAAVEMVQRLDQEVIAPESAAVDSRRLPSAGNPPVQRDLGKMPPIAVPSKGLEAYWYLWAPGSLLLLVLVFLTGWQTAQLRMLRSK